MPKKIEGKEIVRSRNLFPVVGIGASAGGLDAFKRLIGAIPVRSGMAYIIVQHLHPGHNSSLPELLQRMTAIQVVEISDNVKVEPDHIYVIPENKMLVANDGVLKLSPRSNEGLNLPIDLFFSSLAVVHQSHAIGIILSGTGADGTSGLRDIRKNGGVTFAQEPSSASYTGMPTHAIDEDIVDFVMSPEEIPAKLIQIKNKAVPGNKAVSAKTDKQLPKKSSEEDTFRHVLSLVKARTAVDFSYYKQTTIRRRILRRIGLLQLDDVAAYITYIGQNKTELDTLFQDLLIPVTTFFRDAGAFSAFSRDILPEVMKYIATNPAKPTGKVLRVWVAGCSTGQEAYSIAICLHEFLASINSEIKVQLFATDLSEVAIKKARNGIYSKKEIEGISPGRLHQYFTKTDAHYQVNKEIRDNCVFAIHNFLKDPPFANLNLISCRNVLIYLETFLQKKAFGMFHYALHDKGILWLGKSETTGNGSDLFMPTGKKEKFYFKRPATGRFMNLISEPRASSFTNRNYFMPSKDIKTDDVQKNADDILLSKYTPPGVIVNEQFDIVQFRGATGKYLEPAPGKASLNILKMAKEGLSFEIRNALHKAKASGEAFLKEDISISNGSQFVSVEAIPLQQTIDPHYLVLFGEHSSAENNDTSPQKKKKVNKISTDEKDKRIGQLEKELGRLRDDMRSITEEQEAANEELQSANEELLSGSEELQSLNEELETSKEELQSSNEELISVNQELFDRNEELNQSRKFAELVTATFHEPMLILDKNFMVKSANKSFFKEFSINEEDTLDHYFFELHNGSWDIPKLRNELVNIQKKKEKMIEMEATCNFPSIGERSIEMNLQPILRQNGELLILVALNDITIKKASDLLREKEQGEENLRLILESLPQITVTVSADGKITFFNQYFLEYSGLTFEQAIASSAWKFIIHPDDMDEVIKNGRHSLEKGEDLYKELRLKRKSGDSYHWHLCRATALKDSKGNITSWICTATDIHEQKVKEQKKDEFISIASHEMKTPLTTLKGYLQLLTVALGNTNDTASLYTTKANLSVNRLNDLVTELLDASKIQNGRLDYHISSFDFNEMVATTVDDAQYISPDHEIILEGKITKKVTGDRDRLQQVVINLVNNAIKYSPNGGRIVVKMIQEKEELMFSVKDNGIGITKPDLQKIFERYYRVKDHDIRFQGLGIGLFISHEIVMRHHGKLWAESELGKGSTFYVSLPLKYVATKK